MKNKLSIIVFLFLTFYTFGIVKAEYKSKAVTGFYEDSNNWLPRGWAPITPSATSTPNSEVIIVEGADITRIGDLTPVQVDVYGKFRVSGNVTVNAWSGIIVKSGGEAYINGNLSGGAGIAVEAGGLLIVYGNLTSTGSNVTVAGNLVVKGNFSTSSNTELNNTGKLVVGGDFAHAGGDISGTSDSNLYLMNPDANITGPSNWGPIYNGQYGDLEDFKTNESDNEVLKDIVESVMPELVGPIGPVINEWTGAKDSIWFDAENWNPKVVPTSSSNVLIKPVEESNWNPILDKLNEKITFENLTIEAGASLTIKPGSSLFVSQDFENKGEFIIQSSYEDNKISSFYAAGNTIGVVKIEITLPTNSWYYLSTPMKYPKADDFESFKEGFNGGTPYYYNYVDNVWKISPKTIEVTEGVSAYYLANNENEEVILQYEGELNRGTVTKTMTKKGFYLFGNPFAVPINWQDEKMVREKVAGTIWYRTRVEGDKGSEMGFVTYNRYAPDEGKVAVYPDEYSDREEEFGIIQPYQSVWVYTRTATAANPAEITISNAQKVPNNQGGTLKSSSAGKKADIIRVVSKNSISRDGAVIYFSEDATDGSDDAGDSPKYFNSSVDIPEVYTKVGSNSLAINGLAPFEGEYELPLSVRNRTTDEVTLSFNLSNYRKDDVIVLYDKYLDEKINLRSTNKYSYTPLSLGDDHNRFVMLFNPEGYEDENVSTDISDILADANDSQNISIVEKSGNAIVTVNQHLLDKGAGKIEVYSIDGVKLSESVIYSSKTLVVLPKDKGVYVVAATASGERKVVKLLIK